jgi:hypothetical protein
MPGWRFEVRLGYACFYVTGVLPVKRVYSLHRLLGPLLGPPAPPEPPVAALRQHERSGGLWWAGERIPGRSLVAARPAPLGIAVAALDLLPIDRLAGLFGFAPNSHLSGRLIWLVVERRYDASVRSTMVRLVDPPLADSSGSVWHLYTQSLNLPSPLDHDVE